VEQRTDYKADDSRAEMKDEEEQTEREARDISMQ
jgi:hypothetical protein